MNNQELTELLKKNNIITDEQLKQLADTGAYRNKDDQPELSLGKTLIEKGIVTLEQLLDTLNSSGHDVSEILETELQSFINDKKVLGGKYILVKKLGQGGMGIVYKAYDQSLKRYVALKFVDCENSDQAERFHKEAEVIARLNHPNIVPIFEIGTHNNTNYIAMQYIEGKTLSELKGILSIKEVIDVFFKASNAIIHAHEQGIVHRDIKPSNVIVGPNNRVFVMDFGISKEADSKIDITREDILGTPMYMSPEQAKGGSVDYRSDIYSVGATMYSVLTGHEPYEGTSPADILNKVEYDDPLSPRILNPKIDRDLEIMIRKCMFKEPSLRYQNLRELKDDLTRYTNGEPIKARGPSITYIILKTLRRRWIGAALFLVILYALFQYIIPSVAVKMEDAKEVARIEAIGLLRENNRKARPHYEKGVSYFNRARFTRAGEDRRKVAEHMKIAIDEFSNAIEIDELFSDAYIKRGTIYFRMGNFVEANKDFTRAIELAPEFGDAYFMRIMSNFMDIFNNPATNYGAIDISDNYEEIKSDYENLVMRDYLHAKLKCAEGVLQRTKKLHESGRVIDAHDHEHFNEALNLFNESIEGDPSIVYGYIMRSLLLISRAHYLYYTRDISGGIATLKQALSDVVRAMQLEPNYVYLYILRSDIHSRLGDHNAAINYIRAAKEISHEDDPMVRLREIQYNLVPDRKDHTIVILEDMKNQWKLPKSHERQARFYLNMSDVYKQLGLYDKALEELLKAQDIAPHRYQELINKLKLTLRKPPADKGGKENK